MTCRHQPCVAPYALCLIGLLLPGLGHAATITVNSTADGSIGALFGNGTCDLREAITAANTNSAVNECPAGSGADTIVFAIPGAGPHLIEINNAVGGDLPDITTDLSINGYSQSGSAMNSLVYATNAVVQVGLRRTAGSATNGLHYFGPGATGVVEGIRITGFVNGILIDGGASLIDLRGNFIGTDGTNALGNNIGVSVTAGSIINIGSSSGNPQADTNLIAGNVTDIEVAGASSHDVWIGQNLIGTSANGNSPLFQASSTGIVVAGAATGPGWVHISANVIGAGGTGVSVRNGVYNTSISANRIGVGGGGGNLGGSLDGISVRSLSGITGTAYIDGNTISHWGRDGVRVDRAGAPLPTAISIKQNSISGNGGLGINLTDTLNSFNTGVDINDAGDADAGPNSFQNYPAVSAAAANAVETQVTWSLNSTANALFEVQFFSSPACSASGNGEGQTYLGSTSFSTDASGNASGTAVVSASTVGAVLTTTATNNSTSNTSEFSACRVITVAAPPAGAPPFMDSIPNQAGTVGTAFSFALAPYITLTESDPILNYVVLSSMPPGLALAANTGIISGIPSLPSNLAVMVAAIDKDGQSNTQMLQINIAAAPPGSPPVMGNLPNQAGTVGTGFSLDLATFATPTNGDPITAYSVASGSLPPGLALNAGTGLISGTPNIAGTYNVTVTASDTDGPSNADAVQFVVVAATPGAGITGVPTLSEWALLLLATLIAGFGAFSESRWRRRQV